VNDNRLTRLPSSANPGWFSYLTTDPQVLGILAWLFGAITILGFWIAIWQIRKVKRVADAAREASEGMAQRIRSHELLAKLGDGHAHLETARTSAGAGEQKIAILCLDLSRRCVTEAQEIFKSLLWETQDLSLLIFMLRDLSERLSSMHNPIVNDPGFTELQRQLRGASELLDQNIARSRYTYGTPGGTA